MACPLLKAWDMRRLALASIVTAAVAFASSPGAAHADGYYFTEQLGGAKISDELSTFVGGGGFTARIALGMRRGSWAVEGWFGVVTAMNAQTYDEGRYPEPTGDLLLMYGLDVKYIKPVAKHLEVYLRGGLSHADAMTSLDGYGGRGLGVGAGVALKGKVSALGLLAWPLFFTKWGPRITGALYVENGVDFFRLHRDGNIRDGRGAVDAQVSRLTIGFALGSDF